MKGYLFAGVSKSGRAMVIEVRAKSVTGAYEVAAVYLESFHWMPR